MKKILLTVLAVAVFSFSAYAEDLRIAAGAGYKNLVEDLASIYEAKTGKKAERMYGNMGQVAAQVKLGGGICLVIGEEAFLKASGVAYSSYTPIGKGVLTLVTRKGLTAKTPEDIRKPEFAKIALPDTEKAIYGKAGLQFLKSTGLYADVEKRIIPAATVPQSGAYALSGEVDAAFVNTTFAGANKDNLGSVIDIEKGYSPLEINAATLPDCRLTDEVKSFLDAISSPDGKKAAKKHGLI
ncbi:molybdate ABC transporter substrate-binding protein [Seleniivibrio woodruffii]|uniref:molybdate ABC transporter substrate-binding protein n=1 Tax=Seleniivibrio woodruffii TaxID=1078050 RepID=UPI00240A8F1A|nr:molybdate ABC transporter substrate-binding protein [Seleniivibrio woodruffii]